MKMRIVIGLLVAILGTAGIWQITSQPFKPAAAQDGTEDIDKILEDYTFLNVNTITDSDFEIANFASDGTATLPLETSIPVACSVVYGTTTDFGKLTLDENMAGGTHSVHSPLISGLESNTTYYYRVQGVDDFGVVYVSDVMTFTTPDFEAMASEIENLASPAKGATVTNYSSAFGDAAIDERWGAGSAFDSNPNTQWSTAGDGDNAWIEVELAQPARIDRVEFWTRAMSDGSSITRKFTVTTDEGETYGPFEILGTQQSYSFDVEIIAQTLRFDLIETTGGNTGAVDIGVFGEFVEEDNIQGEN